MKTMTPTGHLAAIVVGASIFALGGCMVDRTPTGPLQHESTSIDLDKSELVRVQVRMGAGVLKIRGGSPKLMEGDFAYNVASWKPEVHYDRGSFRGQLTIEQPSHGHGAHNMRYEWDLRFNDDVPLDMSVEFGAGEGNLELGSLTLRSLNVQMGVGKLDVDLRGTPKNDYAVNIHGGVGEANVRLPASVGVIAEATGGIGGISARGLTKHGNRYVNDAYEKGAKVNVRVDVRGGIGAINLIGE
jgi:hypothetical protein